MTFNINDLDDAINEAQKTVENLKKRRKEITNMKEDQQLAVYIHDKQCKCNADHTEECSWYYGIVDEIHDWREYSHKTYLSKAQELLKISDFETIVSIIKAL